MEKPSIQQSPHISENGGNESNFVFDSIASQSFGNYLADTDIDSEHSALRPRRRWVWYCKLRTCPKYYSTWSCKSNFLLHLYETPLHREDATTRIREGRHQLARSWREETAYDLSEPKKGPPQESDEGEKGTMERLRAREASRHITLICIAKMRNF
jgi:hypothetical protein